MGQYKTILNADERSYRLYLARVNLDDSNPGRDKLPPQAVCEAPDGGLGGAVDAAAGVRLAAGNATNVDDVSGSALRPLEEDGQNRLGNVNQARDVGREHDVDVLFDDFRGFGSALDKTTVNCITFR